MQDLSELCRCVADSGSILLVWDIASDSGGSCCVQWNVCL